MGSPPLPHWHLLSFIGPDVRESRLVVDPMAVREDSAEASNSGTSLRALLVVDERHADRSYWGGQRHGDEASYGTRNPECGLIAGQQQCGRAEMKSAARTSIRNAKCTMLRGSGPVPISSATQAP